VQSRKLSLGVAAAAIAVAVVLFAVLKGNGGSDSPSETKGTTKITFRNGTPVGGVRDIDIAEGDPVRIDVTPDVPAEVHVHGYEIEKDVKPGQTAKFDFQATAEGVFEVEVHHLVNGEDQTGVQVAELTVTP
jgi:hypothetical protein